MSESVMTDPSAPVRKWLGSIEVNRRQQFIALSDKLQEMVGGSALIADTIERARLAENENVQLIWPVSGVLRFSSENLLALADLLWRLRGEFVYELGLPITISVIGYEKGRLAKAIEDAELEARKLKDAPQGVDGNPSSPLFVPCSIQPELPANIWRPWPPDREDRRTLVSAWSEKRRQRALVEYPLRFKCFGVQAAKMPHKQDDLVIGSSDSYVALIKADADGVGALLPHLNPSDETDARTFAGALDECVRSAYKKALDETLAKIQLNDRKFPFIPIVSAGEDIWILASRDVALPFALNLINHFAKEAAESDAIKKLVKQVSGATLTLSVGVLFSRQGYPMDARLDLAEELLHSAKQYRRLRIQTGLSPEGCVDFFWLESSTRHKVADARTLVQDGAMRYKLHSRPWAASDLERWIEVAKEIASDSKDGIARRKLKQLETLLRRGKLAKLAFEQWQTSLTKSEQKSLNGALKKLGWDLGRSQSPWKFRDGEFVTPLAELAELSEILRSSQEIAETAGEASEQPDN
jgi:hypothetical protein